MADHGYEKFILLLNWQRLFFNLVTTNKMKQILQSVNAKKAAESNQSKLNW